MPGKEIDFIYDDAGRIVEATQGSRRAIITWQAGADTEYCNFVIKAVCSARGVVTLGEN